MGREAPEGLDLRTIQVVKGLGVVAGAQTEKDLGVRVKVLLAKYPEALIRVQVKKVAKDLEVQMATKQINQIKALRNLNKMSIMTKKNNF